MIEIIPKPGVKAPPWQIYLFYFSIALLIGLILSYFILGSLVKKSLTALENIKTEISKGKTPENLALEKEVKVLEKKIRAFSQMTERHFRVSNFFKEVEIITHPRVRYSHLNLDTETGKLTISGLTDSFSSLGQQLLIFGNYPKISEVNLSKIAIGKKGQIEFSLDLSLSPDIFK